MSKIKIAGLILIFFICGNVFIVNGQEKMNMDNIEQIYRKGVSEFLSEQLDLKSFDDELKSDKMNYIPRDDEYKTEYQKRDKLGLEYIFLRNDIHAERLSEQQIALLKKQNPEEPYSDEIMELIKNTYVDVLSYKKIESEADKTIKTFYDSQFNPVFVSFDTIVIRIATMPEYDKNGNYVDEKHESDKESSLKKFASSMQSELSEKLGNTPISVQTEF